MKVLVQHGLNRRVPALSGKRFLIILNVCLVTLLSTVTLVSAGTIPGSFKQIDMEDGGYLPVVIQHSSGRLYGRTDGGGVYRSDNHGDSWTFLSGDFTTDGALVVQGIAVRQSPGSDSNLLLQATGCGDLPGDPSRGIWKTTDGGATWTHRLTANFSGGDQERIGGDCLIFHPGIDTEAWAGSRGQGLWKSVDSGDTWTEVGGATLTNVIFTSVCIHSAFPDQIFAAGDGGLWVSVNHGTSWTKLKTFDLIMRVTRKTDGTVFFGGLSGGIRVIQKITAADWTNPVTYTCTDLRTAYLNGDNDNGNAITCVLVLRDGRLIVGDVNGSTRISGNDGGSFTTLPDTPVSGVPVPKWASPTRVWRANSLIQDVAQANTWYGGAGYGPIRTDDGGQTWRYICAGIGQVVTYKVGFHPSDPNRIYIPCADHGAAVVTDGGLSGNVAGMATQSFPWPNEICMFSHRALSATINGTNRVIFPGGGQINNRTANLYESLNDGATWFKPAGANLPTTDGHQIVEAVDSLDNPNDFLVICGGTTGIASGGVYRTTNGGASFTQCSGIPSGLDLGGAFWFNASLERDATNLAVRYFFLRQYPPTSGGGLFRSTDRGANWTRIWAPDNNWYGTIVADHARSSNLWFSVSGDTKGLARSTNGGMTWVYDTSFRTVDVADALDGRICLFGQRTNDTWNKIYYSTNDGGAWDEITRPGYRFANVRSVACDPYRPGTVWISTDQRSVGIFTPAGSPVVSIRPKPDQPGTIELSWPGASGVQYSVYKTTNLFAAWPAQPLTNSTSSNGATMFFREPVGILPTAFYRLKAVWN
jgi:xyloglucan-specific exo-beta-1,4-glucanase